LKKHETIALTACTNVDDEYLWNILISLSSTKNNFHFLPQGTVYRYIIENVWIKDDIFQEIFSFVINLDLLNSTQKNPYKPIGATLIQEWFHGGVRGLEVANYFHLNPNPYTAKKIRCIQGNHFAFRSN
jgi:hypothetical protein